MTQTRFRTMLTLLCLVIPLSFAGAEETPWNTDKADNGKTSVQSRISERIDENGNSVPLVEYKVTTTETVSFEKCISVLKKISNHTIIMDTKSAEKIREVSGTEWIVYYYYKGMGPVADSDNVVTMIFSEDPNGKSASVTLTAAPSEYEQKSIKRTTYFRQTYVYTDLGNGNVEITITSASSPPVKVPLWMIKAAFPKVAVDVMHRFVKLAKEN